MIDEAGIDAFILANTEIAAPPLLPELRLRLACAVLPIWQATESTLQELGIEPPYWAFCWPGSQALARLLLDQPERVRGRLVLD
ncbi:MAG TPA: methyltransferase, partial [Rhodospirillales bacterium]|nr:methyltransferase [Rhodospirillales bacterium]